MAMYKAITVFLLAMTIVLGIYIFTHGWSAYKATRQHTESTLNPSIECSRYIYSVDDIDYGDSRLSFLFKNEEYSDHEISRITLKSDMNFSQTITKQLYRGNHARISLEGFGIGKNFTIYPDNCLLFAKTCTLQTGECLGYEPPSYRE
ncbi:hypothetical protein HYU11_03695 [Candidatus Woesearchaeota archaeon]|nr:hypothetical protein [Candidatus Woesearchaeota archaeon]